MDQQLRQQRAVDDKTGITLDRFAIVAVIMNAVTVEGKGGIPKQQRW
jgi:hypothetical protein